MALNALKVIWEVQEKLGFLKNSSNSAIAAAE